MGLERERAHRLVDQPVRVVLGAHPPLLRHHLPLGVDLGGVQEQVPHPVRLDPEHQVELVRRDVGVVAGQVLAGVGVVATAVLLDEAGDLPAAVGGRALEHHVLEEVGQPGRAGPLVARAHPVEDLHRDDRVARVVLHEHPQPVVEGGLGHRELLCRGRRRRLARCGSGPRQPAEQCDHHHEKRALEGSGHDALIILRGPPASKLTSFREDAAEHRPREAPGEGVLLARVEAAQQGDAVGHPRGSAPCPKRGSGPRHARARPRAARAGRRPSRSCRARPPRASGPAAPAPPAGTGGSGRISTGVGLLAGGAQRSGRGDVGVHGARGRRPRERMSAWLAKPASCSARKSQSPLRSPVNMRPVRLPPWAAGASPTSSTTAAGSPKPGSGRAQYAWPR